MGKNPRDRRQKERVGKGTVAVEWGKGEWWSMFRCSLGAERLSFLRGSREAPSAVQHLCLALPL